jgi:hypothetical protein
MRVVVLYESPAADSVAEEFCRAAETFNRGLDIRLRFLEVGFDLRRLAVPAGAEPPAAAFEKLVDEFRPGAALALGDGPDLLECATVAARAGVSLCVLGAESRTGAALARLSRILILSGGVRVPGGEQTSVHTIEDDRSPGEAMVAILVRSAKEIRE